MNAKTSALIVVIVVAILGVMNFIVGDEELGNFRLDLTQQHLFTLSPGTKKILNDLNPDKPVQIRFYITRDNRLMPQWIQSFARSVEDLLIQFKDKSDNKVSLQVIDVRPNTEEEDRARADDIQGHPVNENEDKVYFGLVVQCLQQKEVIPSIGPEDESAMEYKIARAIAKVTKTKRTVIGVLSAMPIAGPAMNLPPMLAQNQRQPWIVIQQLRLDYDVREVPMTTDKIDSDINVLLVVHPAGITGKAQFAIDQYLLKGGKVAAFVDPNCAVSQMYNQQGQFGMSQNNFTPPSSDLPDLFKAWGISFSTTQVVADMKYSATQGRRAVPAYLTIRENGINKTEPVTSALGVVQMFEAGAFKVEKKEGIDSVNLLESSEDSAMIDTATAEKSRREDLTNFQSEGKKHILALRLSGKFKTAFPDGQPKDQSPKDRVGHLPGDAGGETQDAGAPGSQPAAQPAPTPTPAAPATTTPSPAPTPAPAAPAVTTQAPAPTPAPAAPAATTPAPTPAPAAPAATTPAPDPAAPATEAPKLVPAPVPATSRPVPTPTPTPAAAQPAHPDLPKPAPTTVTTPPVSAPAPVQVTPAAAPAKPAPAPVQPAPAAAAKAGPAVPSAPAAKPEAKPVNLKESQNGEGVVYLFSDADMLFDQFCFQQTQMGLVYNSSNAPLLLNVMEQLSGGADLIQVRSRGVVKRPFTKLQELNERVSQEYRPRIESLNNKLNEIVQKISTLKVSQDKNGNMVLIDPQQKKDLEAALSTQKDIQGKLRDIKKEQSRGKDRLEMWITAINLLLVPVLIAALGLLLALRRITLRAAH